jgi:hypothetical protein
VDNITQEFAPYEAKIYMQGRLVANIISLMLAGQDSSTFLPTLNKYFSTLGKGSQSFSVQMELYQSDYEALLQTVPVGKSLLDKGLFNITVTYVSEDAPAQTVSRRIKNVKFNSFGEKLQAGSQNQTMSLSGIASKIERA